MNTKPENVKTGDILAFVKYVRVTDVDVNRWNNRVSTTDLDEKVDNVIDIRGKVLIERSFSADQHPDIETVALPKTQLAEKFINVGFKPFTVTWTKADGNDRTLRGRLKTTEPLLGRSYVEDLDVPVGENRTRLVDHRTIKVLIVNGVKYTVED